VECAPAPSPVVYHIISDVATPQRHHRQPVGEEKKKETGSASLAGRKGRKEDLLGRKGRKKDLQDYSGRGGRKTCRTIAWNLAKRH